MKTLFNRLVSWVAKIDMNQCAGCNKSRFCSKVRIPPNQKLVFGMDSAPWNGPKGSIVQLTENVSRNLWLCDRCRELYNWQEKMKITNWEGWAN